MNRLVLIPLLLIALVLGIFVTKNTFIQKETLTSQSTLVSNWETYTNEFFDFSIKYPGNWFVYEDEATVILGSSKENLMKEETSNKQLRVIVVRNSLFENQTLEDFINFPTPPKILSEKKLSIAGSSGKELVVDSEPRARIVYLPKGPAVYMISVTPADSELMSIFEEMLQSFKFAN